MIVFCLIRVLLIDYGQTVNAPLHKLVYNTPLTCVCMYMCSYCVYSLVKVSPNSPLSLTPPLAECFPLSIHHETFLPSISPPWSDVVTNEFTTLLGTDASSYDGGWGYAAYCTKTDEGLQIFYKSPNGKMVSSI